MLLLDKMLLLSFRYRYHAMHALNVGALPVTARALYREHGISGSNFVRFIARVLFYV